MIVSRFVAVCGVALSVVLGAGAPARAATLSFYDDASALAGLRFTLGCGATATADCAGKAQALKAAPGLYDAAVGQMFDLGNSGSATELAFVNANLFAGDPALAAHGGKDELGVASIVTSALYILVKTGGGGTGASDDEAKGKKDKSEDKSKLSTAVIRNVTGGVLTLTFSAAASGAGLSHYSFFGFSTPPLGPEPGPDPVANVPLPAAGWLLLTSLGALGFAAKRRKAA